MAKKSSGNKNTKPPVGMATGAQTQRYGISGMSFTPTLRPEPATIATYRKMRRVPTVAVARMIATAPIKATPWSYEAQDGVPDDRVKFIQDAVTPVLYPTVCNMALALDYGFQAFEYVWRMVEGRMIYQRIKPLAPDNTKILVVKKSGDFAGIKQGETTLLDDKCFVFTYDEEYGNFYGRSRNENVRQYAYTGWVDTFDKLRSYTRKAAGTTPMIRYPIGQANDSSGSVQDNMVLANQILQHLGQGEGVTMPQIAGKYAEELIARQIDPKDLASWAIEFIEPARNHGDEMLNMLRYWDALICRGWLVPERGATEASISGSRADNEGATASVLMQADEFLIDIACALNRNVVDPLLVYNFGPDAAGTITLVPGSASKGDKATIINLVNGVLTNPANLDLLLQAVDFDAALDRAGIPKSQEVVDLRQFKQPVDETSEMLAAVRKTYGPQHAK
jgi:hypothetical protein